MEQPMKSVVVDNATVELYSHSDIDKKITRGRALVDCDKKRFSFVENSPRPPRSVEVSRGEHCRMVRRHDGLYTLTFRFDGSEKYLLSTLQAEIRNIVKIAQADCVKVKSKKTQQDEEKKNR